MKLALALSQQRREQEPSGFWYLIAEVQAVVRFLREDFVGVHELLVELLDLQVQAPAPKTSNL